MIQENQIETTPVLPEYPGEGVSEIEIHYKRQWPCTEKLTSSKAVYELFLNNWDLDKIDYTMEVKVLYLDTELKPIAVLPLASGSQIECRYDTRAIFAVALKIAAVNIMLVHNNPSGSLTYSASDRMALMNLARIGKDLEIKVLDMIIISRKGFISLSDDCVI